MGVWKVPTGLVDAKEDLHVAAVREVKEETGMCIAYIMFVRIFIYVLRILRMETA
jgi:ADP-ribose pyrophosphatase YjhB (NUDIX family)